MAENLDIVPPIQEGLTQAGIALESYLSIGFDEAEEEGFIVPEVFARQAFTIVTRLENGEVRRLGRRDLLSPDLLGQDPMFYEGLLEQIPIIAGRLVPESISVSYQRAVRNALILLRYGDRLPDVIQRMLE